MNQVVYVNGQLVGALTTVVKPTNGPARAGIAWFAVSPQVSGSTVSATLSSQGYLSVNQAYAIYPSVALNLAGRGAIAFTLVGHDFFPSAAYAPFNTTDGAGDVHLAGAGVLPEDGFTGYAPYQGNGVARWGDYSAASVDSSGNVWMAAEWIPDTLRTQLADWGTFITRLVP
jgi:hypothetical protein